jgi:hypothetical protein
MLLEPLFALSVDDADVDAGGDEACAEIDIAFRRRMSFAVSPRSS